MLMCIYVMRMRMLKRFPHNERVNPLIVVIAMMMPQGRFDKGIHGQALELNAFMLLTAKNVMEVMIYYSQSNPKITNL